MLKIVIALISLFYAPFSFAAIEVASPETWTLYQGTRIVQPREPYPTKAACQAAAPLDVQHRCVGSETFTRRADAPPPPPPPPPPPAVTVSARFQPDNVTSGQSTSLIWSSTGASSCSVSAKGQSATLPSTSGTVDAGAQTESFTATVTCGSASTTASLTVSAAPAPTCTAPRPAQETRTQSCPSGTTGTWSQSRSYVAAAYPTCWAAGEWTPVEAPAGTCVPVVDPPPPPPPPPPADGVSTTFDALYAPGFTLKALDNATIVQQPRPAKSSGINAPSYTDPAYGTKVFKITDTATDGNVANVSHIRHDYSRRQAFNADSSRYIAQDGNGFWALFDGNTFKRINGKRSNGMLAGLAGDAEPIWHPTDPKLLWYTTTNGGLTWFEKNVETDTDTVLVNFAGRLPWANAARLWTKAEGTTSADGRYFAFMAETDGFSTLGLVCWDRVTNTITTLPASAFGGARPDHISMSPSGKYVVPSWAFNKTLGTRAYTRDFSSYRMLHVQSEHSDLAFGPNGEDVYVVTDYDAGQIRAVNMDTGASFDLMPIYPVAGASYAAHVSGKAYKRPGWVVVSTYADYSNYGSVSPASPQQGMYRKVMAVELKPGGRVLNIAHTQAGRDYGGYYGEHQATVNLDFSRVVFAANFGSGTRIESVMVGLPSTGIPK